LKLYGFVSCGQSKIVYANLINYVKISQTGDDSVFAYRHCCCRLELQAAAAHAVI